MHVVLSQLELKAGLFTLVSPSHPAGTASPFRNEESLAIALSSEVLLTEEPVFRSGPVRLTSRVQQTSCPEGLLTNYALFPNSVFVSLLLYKTCIGFVLGISAKFLAYKFR